MPVRTKDVWTWVTHADFEDPYNHRGNRTALYCNEKKVFSGWADEYGLKLVRSIIGQRKVNAIQLTKLPETLPTQYWSEA